MKLQHLAIPVKDQEKSRHFYEHYFGFATTSAKSYPDGILILRDSSGFNLALGKFDVAPMPDFFHFGFAAESLDDIRKVRQRLVKDGIKIIEEYNDPDYVGVEVKDPDGYTVEAYWQQV